MLPSMTDIATITIPAEPTLLRTVRQIVSAAAADGWAERRDDIRLAVSEVLTHAMSAGATELDVRISETPTTLVISVPGSLAGADDGPVSISTLIEAVTDQVNEEFGRITLTWSNTPE